MDIAFDPAKNARNIAVHGISLGRAIDMEWHSALITEDTRRDYGERRFVALGLIDGRLHVLIHTPRDDKTHCISLRKANKRELRHYADQTQIQTAPN